MSALCTFLFLGGLALMISDGAWFPWANLVGLGMMMVCMLLCREHKMMRGDA